MADADVAPVPATLEHALAQHRVVVLTRQGCHLCTEALGLVEDVAPDRVALDVDADPALRARYTDHVPVVFVDGRLFAYWTLDRDRLADALAGGAWSAPANI